MCFGASMQLEMALTGSDFSHLIFSMTFLSCFFYFTPAGLKMAVHQFRFHHQLW